MIILKSKHSPDELRAQAELIDIAISCMPPGPDREELVTHAANLRTLAELSGTLDDEPRS